MEEKQTKKNLGIIIAIIISIILIILAGIYFCMIKPNNETNLDNSNVVSENKKPRKQKALTTEMKELKTKIEQDEAGYGNNYQKFEYCPNTYKRKPDRIYFKDPAKNGFFVFEKDDEDFEHLLEVTEDRMAYTTMEDYNLYSFTPESINTMMKSKDTYIIFDYDNENLSQWDSEYNKDIIFRFKQNTRLYRLVTYLSYFKELIPRENLDKEEFANNTNASGFSYMMYDDSAD